MAKDREILLNSSCCLQQCISTETWRPVSFSHAVAMNMFWKTYVSVTHFAQLKLRIKQKKAVKNGFFKKIPVPPRIRFTLHCRPWIHVTVTPTALKTHLYLPCLMFGQMRIRTTLQRSWNSSSASCLTPSSPQNISMRSNRVGVSALQLLRVCGASDIPTHCLVGVLTTCVKRCSGFVADWRNSFSVNKRPFTWSFICYVIMLYCVVMT